MWLGLDWEKILFGIVELKNFNVDFLGRLMYVLVKIKKVFGLVYYCVFVSKIEKKKKYILVG